MTTLTFTARLISAAIAVVMTLGLFGSVVSVAEPQRSVLMAKHQAIQARPATPVEVALASNRLAASDK